ncbi:MAG: undecaprenyl-diphosphatase UppP [Chloroflexota bacterium]
MTLWEAILLGIIQGVTEFVPVSSSGHLLLIPDLFNLATPDLTLIAVSHIATILAVIVYFRQDLWQIAVAVIEGLRRRRPMGTSDARLGWFIAVGTIPAAVVGFTLKDYFDAVFAEPLYAAFFLLGTAALLVTGEKLLAGDKTLTEMNWTDAIIIGLFQTLALFPGVSRSGSTIVGGLLRGLDRHTAARYSFLLSVPIVAGAGLFEIRELSQLDMAAVDLMPLIVVFVVSGLVGIACIHFLLEWLKRRSLYSFAIYCVTFSLIYLTVAFLR